MDRDTAAGICRSYLESFATGDPQAIAAHVTDGFVNDHASALGSGLVGKAAYLERLPGFLASMPGLRYEPGEPIVEGSRVAAPYTLHATATDPAGTTVPITIRGVMLIDLDGELVARRLDVWDALTYMRQSGQA